MWDDSPSRHCLSGSESRPQSRISLREITLVTRICEPQGAASRRNFRGNEPTAIALPLTKRTIINTNCKPQGEQQNTMSESITFVRFLTDDRHHTFKNGSTFQRRQPASKRSHQHVSGSLEPDSQFRVSDNLPSRQVGRVAKRCRRIEYTFPQPE